MARLIETGQLTLDDVKEAEQLLRQLGGTVGPQDAVTCLDGTSLIVFDDRFWAVTGQQVVEPDDAPLQDTDEYGAAYVTCTGE